MKTEPLHATATNQNEQHVTLTIVKSSHEQQAPAKVVPLHQPKPEAEAETTGPRKALLLGEQAAKGEYRYLMPAYPCHPFKAASYEPYELTRFIDNPPANQAEERYAPLSKASIKSTAFWAGL